MNTTLDGFDRDSGSLRIIPGIGENMERHLMDLGIFCPGDLVGMDPEVLYEKDCRYQGRHVDRCVLYVMKAGRLCCGA